MRRALVVVSALCIALLLPIAAPVGAVSEDRGLPVETGGECSVELGRVNDTVTVDDDGNFTPVKAELSEIELLENALLSTYPCEYSGLELDLDQVGVTLYIADGPSEEDVARVVAEVAPTYQLRSLEAAVLPRHETERLFAAVSEALSSDRLPSDAEGAVAIGRSPSGAVQVTVSGGLRDAVEAASLESLAVELLGDRPDVSAALETRENPDFEDPWLNNNNIYQSVPERGNQARWVQISENPTIPNRQCTAGPYYRVNNVTRGTTAGHCGRVGMGVFGGNYWAGTGNYINPIAQECGWGPGNCFTEVGMYNSRFLGGSKTMFALDNGSPGYFNLRLGGNSSGPPVGALLCHGGNTASPLPSGSPLHEKCGQVTTGSQIWTVCFTPNWPQVPGCYTILKGFEINTLANGGDSGGIVYSFEGNGRTRAWGTVSVDAQIAGTGFGVVVSNEYWTGTSFGATLITCNC